MTAPSPLFGNRDTRALLHVVADPHPTVRSTAQACGDRSTETTSRRLRRLRTQGLVAFDDGTRGTLRANVGAVAFLGNVDSLPGPWLRRETERGGDAA